MMQVMSITESTAAPDEAEIAARIARLRAAMARMNLDAYVTSTPDNTYYLTHFANYVHERPFVLVIGRDGPPRFVAPRLEIPHIRHRAVGGMELVSYREFPAPAGEGWEDALADALGGAARIGVESIAPLQLIDALTGDHVRADLIDDLRMVKSDYELARIAYVCARLTEVHDDMMSGTGPGETMAAFNSKHIGALMKRVLADNPAINMTATKAHAIFQAAEVTHDPHNFTDLALETAEGGPMITLVNGVIDGYGGEVERTFFLGHAPEACKRPFDVMLEARQAALDATRPGALMSDVDRAANEVFIRAGYGENLLHRAGHGIGVTGHEAPFFAEGYDREILPGMVFTMEPGVYIEGVGGFRHSDTLAIGEAGLTMLTSGPIDLEALVLPV